jgi:uncharacterized membrane protein YbhN (UPF0104 family)
VRDVDILGGSRRRVAVVSVAAVAATVAFAALAAGGDFGRTISNGMNGLAGADRRWLWVAAACFVGSLVASAGAWRSSLVACGGGLGRADACARYGVGSLANTFMPARVGEAARVGLFSAAFPRERDGRILTTAGALAAVTAADVLTQAIVVGLAAPFGAVPVSWRAVLAGIGVVAAGLVLVALRRFRSGRIVRLLDVFRSLIDSPGQALRLLAWSGGATAGRLLAAMAVAASLGIHDWIEAGLVMSAVVIVATALPLMPGNLGVTSAAVVVALHARGVPMGSAVAVGLTFHVVEIVAGLAFGVGGVVALSPYPSVGARRLSFAVTRALTGALIVAGLGATFVPQLH